MHVIYLKENNNIETENRMVIPVSKVRNKIETKSKYCYKILKRNKNSSLIIGGSK